MTLNIEAIKKRVEAATPGPWEHSDNYIHVASPSGGRECLAEFYGSNPMEGDNSNDTEFIAHARTDVPELLRWVERAEDVIRTMWADIESIECLRAKTVVKMKKLLAELTSGEG